MSCAGLLPEPTYLETLDMKTCEVCGNLHPKCFEVIVDGRVHRFDSLECAIHALAPICSHCSCRIVGHGLEARGNLYCCAHCASQAGRPQLQLR
jgi:hypothetical protein